MQELLNAIYDRNADLSAEDAMKLADEAVAWARANPATTK